LKRTLTGIAAVTLALGTFAAPMTAVAATKYNTTKVAHEYATTLKSITEGKTESFTVTIKDSHNKAISNALVSFSSSNTSVVTVSKSQVATNKSGQATVVLTGKKPGTAYVTVKVNGNTHTYKVTVVAGTVAITGAPTDGIAVGQKVNLGFTDNGKTVTSGVTWTVDNDAAAVQDGKFIASAPGTYTVTASYGGKKATAKVVVYGQATALQISGAKDIVANTASTETVTITAVDANGNPDRNYNGKADLSINGSGVAFATTGQASDFTAGQNGTGTVTFTKGVATVVLVSNSAVAGLQAKLTVTSQDIKDANGNAVSTSATINTLAQVATSVSVKPDSTTLQDNTATSEHVSVQVLDQDGQPMLWGSFPVTVTVSGQGKLVEGTNNTYTTAYVGNGTTSNEVSVHVSSLTGQSGTIVVNASSSGLKAGSATINAVNVGDATAIKLAVASGSSATFSADNGSTGASFTISTVDKNGYAVTPAQPVTYDVKVTNPDGTTASGITANISGNTLTVTGTKAGTYTVTVSDHAGVLNSASTTVTITAGAAKTVALTSPSTGKVNVPQSNPSIKVTAQIEDQYGNPVSAANVPVEFTATQQGSSGASFTFNGQSTTTYTVNTDSSGKATVTFASQATPNLKWNVTVDKVNGAAPNPAVTPVEVDVVGLPASSLTVSTTVGGNPTSYAKSGDTITFTVTEKDAYGNPSPNGDRVNVTIPAGLSVPSSGSNLSGDATNGYYVTLNQNGTATFTLTAGKAGPQTVTLTDVTNATQLTTTVTVSVSANTQSTAMFFNGSGVINQNNPLTVAADTPVAITLAPTDSAGNVAVSSSDLYYNLGDTTDGGEFRLSPNGAAVTSVKIPAGSTGVTLYYVNHTAGSYYGMTATADTAPNITAATYTAPVAAQAATGSVTIGSPADNDTVTIDGVTFTYVSSGANPANRTFTTADDLVAAIQANSTTNAALTAVKDGTNPNKVDLTAKTPGAAGNNITLATSNATQFTLSGAKLSGGADAVPGKVAITFSGPIKATGVTPANFNLNNGHSFGTGATGAWDSSTNTYTITLGSGATVAAGDTVTTSGITDPAGQPVSSSHLLS
jgi:hypothetical protein